MSDDCDPVIHSFAGDDWQACLDYVRARLGLPPFKPGSDAPRRATPPQASKARDEISDNRATAKWLWKGRKPVTDNCSAGLYLRERRGYHGPIPRTLGYLPANGKHPPAMIAAFDFRDEPEPGVIVNGMQFAKEAAKIIAAAKVEVHIKGRG